MDFINPESARKCMKKAGMKKNKCTTTLFILTKEKNHKSLYINTNHYNPNFKVGDFNYK
jgi:hypothetical protein